MKIKLKKYTQCIILSALILMQSCRVYHKNSVSLEKAVQSKKRIKIKSTKNKTLKYTYIIYQDGDFYGIESNKNSRRYKKVLLNEDEIKTVRLHNKSLSIILGILWPLATLIGFVALAVSSWSGPDVGSINFSY